LRRTVVATVVISLSTSVTTISITKVLVDCVRGIAVCDIHAKFWRQLCDCVKFSQGPYDMAWANILKHGQSSCRLSLSHSSGTCILYDSRHIPWQQHSPKFQFYCLCILSTQPGFLWQLRYAPYVARVVNLNFCNIPFLSFISNLATTV
jgi:hypothetical protein